MFQRLQARWRTLTLRQRVHLVGLVLITAAAVGHQATVWNWYIEDAAISFAYARNAADGYGMVATPGGERIEGYSNPTWVFVLTLCSLVGWSPFHAAKVLGLVCCALTVPLTYLLTRHATAREDSDAPLLASGFLAMNAQFAIWGGSGLENPLFNLLLVTALWRMFVEVRAGYDGDERFPWSAVAWFGLAITRPEALAYAAVGGFFSLVWSFSDGRGLRPTMRWLGAFWTPFLAYHALRFDYFAWELPQTFYAKVGDHRAPTPLDWNSAGWNYFKNWSNATGSGLLLPVLSIGMIGPRASRALIALALGFAWAFPALLPRDHRLLLPMVLVFTYLCYLALIRTQETGPRPGMALLGLLPVGAFIGAAEWMRANGAQSQIPSPDWVVHIPPVMAAIVAVGVPALAFGGRGTRARLVCWTLMTAGLGYAVMVNGDWMRSWRWMSLVAVPTSVLLGVGAESIAQLAQDNFVERADRGWVAYAAAVVLLLAPLPANIIGTTEFLERPETGPFAVKQRVHFKQRTLAAMHHYGPINDLDVDMGAHLYWTEFRMVDIAGLVDVPFAQHRFDRGFVREYVFEEKRPLFAHLHGGWAGTSRIPSFKEWGEQYIEIPGYPAGESIHIGNHIRRDALFAEDWPIEPDRRVDFEDRIELLGWDLPTPVSSPGRRFYLELGLQMHRRRTLGVRIIGFVSQVDGDGFATFDLPPAYDWVPAKQWRRAEIFHGRFSPLLPKDLPLGTYDIGFLMVSENGEILAAEPDHDPSEPDAKPLSPDAILGGVAGAEARLAAGEVRFAGVLTLVAEPEVLAQADAHRDAALAAAGDQRCGEAVDRWALARAARPRSTDWFEAMKPQVHRAIADCLVADLDTEDDAAVVAIRAARDWDWKAPDVQSAGALVGDRRYAQGMAAMKDQDWDTAYAAFSDVIAVQPHRAWARRHAEQARRERLQITAETKKERPDLWESRQVEQGTLPEGGQP